MEEKATYMDSQVTVWSFMVINQHIPFFRWLNKNIFDEIKLF